MSGWTPHPGGHGPGWERDPRQGGGQGGAGGPYGQGPAGPPPGWGQQGPPQGPVPGGYPPPVGPPGGNYPPDPAAPYGGDPYDPRYPDAGTSGGRNSRTGLFLGIGGSALAVIVVAVVAVVLFRGGEGQGDSDVVSSGSGVAASGRPTADGSPTANRSPTANGATNGRTLVAADTAGGLTRDKAYEQQLEEDRKKLQKKYGGPSIDLEKLQKQQQQQAKAAGIQPSGSVSAVYRGEGTDPVTGEPNRVRFFGFYGHIADPQRIIDSTTQVTSDIEGYTTKPVDPGELGGLASCSGFAITMPPIADQEATLIQTTTCTWVDNSTMGTIMTSRTVDETAELMRRMRPDLTQ